MSEIKLLVSKLALNEPNLDDVVLNLTDCEYEELSDLCLIWPNIEYVQKNLRSSNILASGQNWIAIELAQSGQASVEQDQIFEHLESSKYGAPLFDYDMHIGMYR